MPVQRALWWKDQLSLIIWLCKIVSTGLSSSETLGSYRVSSQTLLHTTALRIRHGSSHTGPELRQSKLLPTSHVSDT